MEQKEEKISQWKQGKERRCAHSMFETLQLEEIEAFPWFSLGGSEQLENGVNIWQEEKFSSFHSIDEGSFTTVILGRHFNLQFCYKLE